jgi:hypothetical protein
MLWGGLLMVVAIVVLLAFLGKRIQQVGAVVGGIGFGAFIDELGKFITRDVNYFFQPTIALIYIVFVTMYLVFRTMGGRTFGPDEAVLNALEAVKAASIGKLDETRRREVLLLLDDTHAAGSVADRVAAILRDAPALPPRSRNRAERLYHLLAAHADAVILDGEGPLVGIDGECDARLDVIA